MTHSGQAGICVLCSSGILKRNGTTTAGRTCWRCTSMRRIQNTATPPISAGPPATRPVPILAVGFGNHNSPASPLAHFAVTLLGVGTFAPARNLAAGDGRGGDLRPDAYTLLTTERYQDAWLIEARPRNRIPPRRRTLDPQRLGQKTMTRPNPDTHFVL